MKLKFKFFTAFLIGTALFFGKFNFSHAASCCFNSLENKCRLETASEPCILKKCGQVTGYQNNHACLFPGSEHPHLYHPEFLCGLLDNRDAVDLPSGLRVVERTEVCLSSYNNTEGRIDCSEQIACKKEIVRLNNCGALTEQLSCRDKVGCFFYGGVCYDKKDSAICSQISDKRFCGQSPDGGIMGSTACKWIGETLNQHGHCVSNETAGLANQFSHEAVGLLTGCARDGSCRDINDLIAALFPIAQKVFGLIGAIAFAMFVYGGFTIILSFGNSERVGQGRQILTAAVVGILISFSAYLLIGFLLNVLGVSGVFRGGV